LSYGIISFSAKKGWRSSRDREFRKGTRFSPIDSLLWEHIAADLSCGELKALVKVETHDQQNFLEAYIFDEGIPELNSSSAQLASLFRK